MTLLELFNAARKRSDVSPDVTQRDQATGKATVTVSPQVEVAEATNHDTHWTITKYADQDAFERGEAYAVEELDGNVLLNEGINAVWTLAAGGSETAFNNANARLGVGDSTTAEAASQTGLQAATNFLYKAMDSGYPTYGTAQQIVFRSTFTGSEANFAWNEFSVDNGNTANKNLNRRQSGQGTKQASQVWQLTLTVTLS